MTILSSSLTINIHSSITHRAGWVVIDPYTIIRDGFIRVDSGLIKEVGSGSCNGHIIDHGPGVLLPVLVNAHTHLELCALKDKVLPAKGFRSWVENLINLRNSAEIENLKKGAINGVKELIESGCGVIGEISTLDLTWEIVSNSSLSGVWFKEFIGNYSNLDIKCYNEKSFIKSIAGHAPHTLSPELLTNLKNITHRKNIPFSIHLAESEDEIIFLTTGKGKWANFMMERGLDFSSWNLPIKNPVRYLEYLGVLDENTIAVHLIHAGKKDFEILLRNNVHVCLCLRSNFNLHKMLPDLTGMIRAGIKPCLGTDSLASAESLSIFDEMKFASKSFPSIPPAEILAMATVNGASSLGLGEMFGSLTPGKRSVFVYVPVDVSNSSDLIDTIVNADFEINGKTSPQECTKFNENIMIC